jgi:surfeit locus 1 family protein
MFGRRSRLWPLLATVVGVALAIALGNWQLDRAVQKRELKARYDAQAELPPLRLGGEDVAAGQIALRRVEASGTFDSRYTVLLDNRTHKGVVGYHVLMPLRIAGTDRHVLVNRGWVQGHPDRRTLPQVRTPESPVLVSGVAVVPSERVFELSDRVIEGTVWQNLTIERYRQAMPITIHPFVLRQESPLPDGLTRAWDAPDLGVEKHYGYAMQWFALALTLLVFYAYTQFKRSRSRDA